jgi:eukaryotic-like serine/threonine-protein kinase
MLHADVEAEVCPRCGATLAADLPLETQPTQLFRTWFAQQNTGASEDDESLYHLVGRELHLYHCRSLLGRGGMGWVYLARHRDLHRDCALKILSPKLVGRDPEYLENFYNEGRATACLVHPGIVTTHAIGEHGGHHFLEMEFVPGRSLQQLIDQGPLPPLQATRIICRIAEGLAAAHQGGILHRDLKPDNVLMTHRGQPKIADFGLAKKLHGGGSAGERLAGTPQFMAPELFQGEGASFASDVYSLGVCYFLLLTGQLPFAGRGLNELIMAAINDPLPRVRDNCPDATLEMVECVHRFMERSPANRPQSGIEAAHYIQAVLGHLRDVESLMHDAFDGMPSARWHRDGNRYQVAIQLPGCRTQTIFVETTGGTADTRLLSIFSTCAPAESSYYEQALRLNAEVAHGGIAIRDLDGRSYFVMINTYPRATVDAEDIRKSAFEIAARADAIERHLTGIDIH